MYKEATALKLPLLLFVAEYGNRPVYSAWARRNHRSWNFAFPKAPIRDSHLGLGVGASSALP
jgi:hypothetical protein